MQEVKVHDILIKVVFGSGSSAAFVMHSFAERAHLFGGTVSYWLSAVGHEPVWRYTTSYTLFTKDNSGAIDEG